MYAQIATKPAHVSLKGAQSPLQGRITQGRAARAFPIVKAVTTMVPQIKITKEAPIEKLKSTTAFSLDDFVAGKSKKWYFWDCDPSEFPWSYHKGGEDAYILEGQFYVTYEGGEPVEINAGDFVHFPAGETKFKVTKPVRKFFTLLD